MPTFKIEKNRDFTVMSNHHLRNKNLSLKGKGLMSFFLSLPEDWDYSLDGLVSVLKEGEDAIKTALKELKEHKYLKIVKSKDANGLFDYTYEIYEIPYEENPEGENPALDNPALELPAVDTPVLENPPQINTNIININNKYHLYILFFQKITYKGTFSNLLYKANIRRNSEPIIDSTSSTNTDYCVS